MVCTSVMETGNVCFNCATNQILGSSCATGGGTDYTSASDSAGTLYYKNKCLYGYYYNGTICVICNSSANHCASCRTSAT
jgi:hypothetical protein